MQWPGSWANGLGSPESYLYCLMGSKEVTIGSSEPMQNLHLRFYSEIILNFIIIIIIIILNYK